MGTIAEISSNFRNIAEIYSNFNYLRTAMELCRCKGVTFLLHIGDH